MQTRTGIGVVRAAVVAPVVLVGLMLAACGTSDDVALDRAGNPAAPTVVSVGTEENVDSPAGLVLQLFADEVERAGDGLVEVQVTFGAADGGVAWDQKMIGMVADGEFDLVLARAGAWATHGATSLEALQLPGLVETDEQADRVAFDRDVVEALLAGVGTAGFDGLGLYPEAPRYLMALDEQPTDFGTAWRAGREVRAPLNETVFAVLDAAGMRPVDLDYTDFLARVSDGRITATEGHLARVELTTTVDGDSDAVVATNLPLYTKFLVLAARNGAVADDVLDVLQRAAAATVAPFSQQRPHEADSLEGACAAGGVLVQMTSVERRTFLDAVAPVVEAFISGPDGDLWDVVAASAGPAAATDWTCPDTSTSDVDSTSPEASAPSSPGGGALTLPTKRSDIVPTSGDLPDGVYRFTQTVEDLLLADPGGDYSEANEFIGEFVLEGGVAELRYFDIDGSPKAGEPPDLGGLYQVEGDLMIFATPPERAIPGTTGISLLRWEFEGDTLTLEQIDDGAVDADFLVPWIRVGDVP